MRFRGWTSYVTFAIFVTLAIVSGYFSVWAWMRDNAPFVMAYMSVGFYLTVSIVFFMIWVAAVAIADRKIYWEFSKGQIIENNLLAGGGVAHDTHRVTLQKLPMDFTVNFILGLGWLGLGTADIKLRLPSNEVIIIENVWVARRRMAQIENIIR